MELMVGGDYLCTKCKVRFYIVQSKPVFRLAIWNCIRKPAESLSMSGKFR